MSNISISLFLRNLFTKKQLKPTIIILYGTLAMVLWKYFIVPQEVTQFFVQLFGDGDTVRFWLGTHKIFGAFLFFGAIPMIIIKLVFHERLREYGLRFGYSERLLVNSLMFVPIMFVLGQLSGKNPAFWAVYPFNPTVSTETTIFVCHAMTYLTYYFGWEFFFRGFMQHGLSDSCGIENAILIQTLASTLLHIGHPIPELLGAIIGGLFWGFITLRCQTVFASFLQHSVLGISLDYFILLNRH